ncbi:MAG: hypothetical protein Q3980_15870 [Turicibacter sp.]|nr:hypothetical protein [Turicibacter sp.]
MAKKQVNIRMSENIYEYLIEKCEAENKTQIEVIEELLIQDKQRKNNYVDDLADAISSRLNDKLKPMRIAVNENNKLLKIEQNVLNYLLLAQTINMPYDQYGDYKHDAFAYATDQVNEEIKRLQVIKAEQKIKSKKNKEV